MGCSALPTRTSTPSGVLTKKGTCFSCEASVVFSVRRVIGLPQHTSVPPAACTTSTTLPQMAHL